MDPEQQQRNPSQRQPISLTKRVPQPNTQLTGSDQLDSSRSSLDDNGANNSGHVPNLRINTESANATYVHNPTRPIGNSAMRGTKPPTLNPSSPMNSPNSNPTTPQTPQTPHTPTSPTNMFVQREHANNNPNGPNPNNNPNQGQFTRENSNMGQQRTQQGQPIQQQGNPNQGAQGGMMRQQPGGGMMPQHAQRQANNVPTNGQQNPSGPQSPTGGNPNLNNQGQGGGSPNPQPFLANRGHPNLNPNAGNQPNNAPNTQPNSPNPNQAPKLGARRPISAGSTQGFVIQNERDKYNQEKQQQQSSQQQQSDERDDADQVASVQANLSPRERTFELGSPRSLQLKQQDPDSAPAPAPVTLSRASHGPHNHFVSRQVNPNANNPNSNNSPNPNVQNNSSSDPNDSNQQPAMLLSPRPYPNAMPNNPNQAGGNRPPNAVLVKTPTTFGAQRENTINPNNANYNPNANSNNNPSNNQPSGGNQNPNQPPQGFMQRRPLVQPANAGGQPRPANPGQPTQPGNNNPNANQNPSNPNQQAPLTPNKQVVEAGVMLVKPVQPLNLQQAQAQGQQGQQGNGPRPGSNTARGDGNPNNNNPNPANNGANPNQNNPSVQQSASPTGLSHSSPSGAFSPRAGQQQSYQPVPTNFQAQAYTTPVPQPVVYMPPSQPLPLPSSATSSLNPTMNSSGNSNAAPQQNAPQNPLPQNRERSDNRLRQSGDTQQGPQTMLGGPRAGFQPNARPSTMPQTPTLNATHQHNQSFQPGNGEANGTGGGDDIAEFRSSNSSPSLNSNPRKMYASHTMQPQKETRRTSLSEAGLISGASASSQARMKALAGDLQMPQGPNNANPSQGGVNPGLFQPAPQRKTSKSLTSHSHPVSVTLPVHVQAGVQLPSHQPPKRELSLGARGEPQHHPQYSIETNLLKPSGIGVEGMQPANHPASPLAQFQQQYTPHPRKDSFFTKQKTEQEIDAEIVKIQAELNGLALLAEGDGNDTDGGGGYYDPVTGAPTGTPQQSTTHENGGDASEHVTDMLRNMMHYEPNAPSSSPAMDRLPLEREGTQGQGQPLSASEGSKMLSPRTLNLTKTNSKKLNTFGKLSELDEALNSNGPYGTGQNQMALSQGTGSALMSSPRKMGMQRSKTSGGPTGSNVAPNSPGGNSPNIGMNGANNRPDQNALQGGANGQFNITLGVQPHFAGSGLNQNPNIPVSPRLQYSLSQKALGSNHIHHHHNSQYPNYQSPDQTHPEGGRAERPHLHRQNTANREQLGEGQNDDGSASESYEDYQAELEAMMRSNQSDDSSEEDKLRLENMDAEVLSRISVVSAARQGLEYLAAFEMDSEEDVDDELIDEELDGENYDQDGITIGDDGTGENSSQAQSGVTSLSDSSNSLSANPNDPTASTDAARQRLLHGERGVTRRQLGSNDGRARANGEGGATGEPMLGPDGQALPMAKRKISSNSAAVRERRDSIMNKISLATNEKQMIYSDREKLLLSEIFQFLVQECPNVLVNLFRWLEKTEHAVFAASLLHFSLSSNCTLELLEYLVTEEFKENNTAGKEILRENGVIIQFIKEYLAIVGKHFLLKSCQSLVQMVCVQERKISFEIDPAKEPNPEQLKLNQAALIKRVDIFLNYLSSKEMIEFMHPGLRLLCKYIGETAKVYTPTKVEMYIGSFLMLRFINPALCTPEKFDLIAGKKISPMSRRNLILITKVLQNISNNVTESKKEPWLQSLDLRVWNKTMYDWFGTLVDFQYNPTSAHQNIVQEVSFLDLRSFHQILFAKRKNIFDTIKEKATRDELNIPLDKLGSYHSKEMFALLEVDHQKMVTQNLQDEEFSLVGYLLQNQNIKGKAKADIVVSRHILVVGMYRVWLIHGVKGSVLNCGHHSEITRIIKEAGSQNLEISFVRHHTGEESSIKGQCEIGASLFIASILSSHDYLFPGARIKPEVFPARKNISVPFKQIEAADNIINTYKSFCSYYQTAPVDLICYYLQNLLDGVEVLDFTEFTDHFPKPITDNAALPLLHALGYNRVFNTLKISKFRFTDVTFQGFIKLSQLNCSLTTLSLESISVSSKLMKKFLDELPKNNMPIDHLSIINYPLDKLIGELATAIRDHKFNWVLFNFTGCFTKTSPAPIIETMAQCTTTSMLETLIIGKCKLGECDQLLKKLLMKTNRLRQLLVPESGTDLATILSVNHKKLQVISVEQNRLKDNVKLLDASIFDEFNLRALTEVNVSNTCLPIENFLALLLAKDASFGVIARNNNFGLMGAFQIGKSASRIVSINKLDLADNNFTLEGTKHLIAGLCSNATVNYLDISRNFEGKDDHARKKLVKQLATFSDSLCPIQVLIMQGGGDPDSFSGSAMTIKSEKMNHLRETLSDFFLEFSCKGSTIRELDITGHLMGDRGAVAMSKLIQQTNVLKRLHYDDNGIGQIGYINIYHALQKNSSLEFMSVPLLDLTKFQLENKSREREECSKIIQKIEKELTLTNVKRKSQR